MDASLQTQTHSYQTWPWYYIESARLHRKIAQLFTERLRVTPGTYPLSMSFSLNLCSLRIFGSYVLSEGGGDITMTVRIKSKALSYY